MRESGSADESLAADYIAGRLGEYGIPHEVYEPELFLSLPRDSAVRVGRVSFRAKPPSFARPTGPGGLRTSVVHVPAAATRGTRDLFASHHEALPDVTGQIVVTEGYAMPLTVQRFEAAGAAGQIYINPGVDIHWGICTPVWGTPSETDLEALPSTPVVAVNRPDGDAILAAVSAGEELTLQVALEQGWYPCKLPVARIAGRTDPFVLVHGHYDSWDVGVGDNAVGDATLLELARVFHEAERPERSLWIAWWPGHSTGRYAGSTWFADRFALELRKNGVAAVNIDSPGCWHATEYDEVMWMAEAGPLCERAIRDATGQRAVGHRPLRAGDYSFDQIGLTSFFMLLSNIPEAERAELGFYPTGGCGGNIAWHTENDTLEVADRDNLERDLRVYVTALSRVLDAPVLPFDYRESTRELSDLLTGERQAAENLGVDLEPLAAELRTLARVLDVLYRRIEGGLGEAERDVADRALIEVSRRLVPARYAQKGRFVHDPALPRHPVPALGRLEDAAELRDRAPERLPFLRAEVQREVNRAANLIYEGHREAEWALSRIGYADASGD